VSQDDTWFTLIAIPPRGRASHATPRRYRDIIHDMPKPAAPSTTPLFVRLPADAAKRLDRAAFERGASKRELVTDAVVRLLDDRVTVGRAEVAAPADPEVLTVEQAAELLQVDTDTIRALARQGELPGRKVGREWRFSRAAVLAWLGGDS
jgi:excisionase family DNA binding protein